MSRTIRRARFNTKKRFFKHFFEDFSDMQVIAKSNIELWKYHSDSYYTQKFNIEKIFHKNLEYRIIRRKFKQKIYQCDFLEHTSLEIDKPRSIKLRLH